MASTPSSSQVRSQAENDGYDARTPGLNVVVSAWGAAQDFSGNWAVATYNSVGNLSNLLGSFVT